MNLLDFEGIFTFLSLALELMENGLDNPMRVSILQLKRRLQALKATKI